MSRLSVLLHRELRDRAGLGLALALVLPLLSCLAQVTWTTPGDEVVAARWILPGLLALLLALWGADLGAREQEQGTDRSLARLPVGRSTVACAKLLALLLGGSLLCGWSLCTELLWRRMLGWPTDPLLLELLDAAPRLLPLPLLGTVALTLGLVLGRTLVAVLAAAALVVGAPLALVSLGRSHAGIDRWVFELSRLGPLAWLLALQAAAVLAAFLACRPGEQSQGRALAGAALGAALVLLPVGVVAPRIEASTDRLPGLEVAPSPDGRYVALEVEEGLRTWWGYTRENEVWLHALDGAGAGEPLRLEFALARREHSWTPEGLLQVHDLEAERVRALDPETGELSDVADPLGQWGWWRVLPTAEGMVLDWRGHRTPLRRALPMASDPGLVVWIDREAARLESGRMDAEERRTIWRGEGLGGVIASPWSPVLMVRDSVTESLVYVHAVDGQVLAGPLPPGRGHACWVDGDRVYAVTHEDLDRGTRFTFLGSDPPAPIEVPHPHARLRMAGEERVVTFGRFGPTEVPGRFPVEPHAEVRDLEGRVLLPLLGPEVPGH